MDEINFPASIAEVRALQQRRGLELSPADATMEACMASLGQLGISVNGAEVDEIRKALTTTQ